MSYLKTPLGLGITTNTTPRATPIATRRGTRDHRSTAPAANPLAAVRRVVAQPARGTGQARDHRTTAPTQPPRGSGQARDHRNSAGRAPADQRADQQTLPPIVYHPPSVPVEPPTGTPPTSPTDVSVLVPPTTELPPATNHPPTGPTGVAFQMITAQPAAVRTAPTEPTEHAELDLIVTSAPPASKPNYLLYGGLAVAAIGALWYFRSHP